MDILRSVAIGLYLEQPISWLHRLDPRVKLFWLLSFLLSPVLANAYWRIGVMVLLIAITLAARIPWRVWRQQMGFLLLLAAMTFAIATLSPDGLKVAPQPRRPPDDLAPAIQQTLALPQPTPYRYVLVQAGSVQVTRRSLDLGIRVSTLLFTFIYAPTLYLLVTSPEEIAAAIVALASPLRFLRVPVVEIALTLTLALRFVPLVLEEVQNLVRAIRTRAIHWKRLGFKRTLSIWAIVVERLIDNLFVRADRTATAMEVRGFTSPDRHLVKWNPLRLTVWDGALGLLLAGFWLVRLWLGGEAA